MEILLQVILSLTLSQNILLLAASFSFTKRLNKYKLHLTMNNSIRPQLKSLSMFTPTQLNEQITSIWGADPKKNSQTEKNPSAYSVK